MIASHRHGTACARQKWHKEEMEAIGTARLLLRTWRNSDAAQRRTGGFVGLERHADTPPFAPCTGSG